MHEIFPCKFEERNNFLGQDGEEKVESAFKNNLQFEVTIVMFALTSTQK